MTQQGRGGGDCGDAAGVGAPLDGIAAGIGPQIDSAGAGRFVSGHAMHPGFHRCGPVVRQSELRDTRGETGPV